MPSPHAQPRLRRLARLILTTGLVLFTLVGAGVARHRHDAAPPRRPLTTPAMAIAAPPGLAAPARGVTGTTTLPALPTTAVTGDAGITPARPFAFGRATPLDRGRALHCLTAAIYYEAATEPDAGQRAVAQVVLNRVRHPAFPATVCGVVFQGADHAGCQFSFACDGAMARPPVAAAWARAAHVAGAALAGYVFAAVGLATHYHTYAVTPAWNRSLVMTDAVGAHFFHRWKGYWGTAAAFHQPYRGGEPDPGPPVATPTPAPAPPPIVPVAPPLAARPPVERPPLPAVTATDEETILPRWKDSGQPIAR